MVAVKQGGYLIYRPILFSKRLGCKYEHVPPIFVNFCMDILQDTVNKIQKGNLRMQLVTGSMLDLLPR